MDRLDPRDMNAFIRQRMTESNNQDYHAWVRCYREYVRAQPKKTHHKKQWFVTKETLQQIRIRDEKVCVMSADEARVANKEIKRLVRRDKRQWKNIGSRGK